MEDQTNESSKKASKGKNRRLPVTKLLIGLILVGSIGLSGYLYTQLQDAKNNPDKISQQQVEDLVGRVGKLISLPSDEQPTVATVQDKEKLKDQPFFAGAENGDKLLIYTTAQKAIIYRESSNLLVNVGPVTLDTAAPAGATSEPAPAAEPANSQQ